MPQVPSTSTSTLPSHAVRPFTSLNPVNSQTEKDERGRTCAFAPSGGGGEAKWRRTCILLLLHNFRAENNHISPSVLMPSTAQSLPCSPSPQHSPGYVAPHPESLRVQVTPAAFAWVQGWSLGDPLGQNMRKDSFPTHCSSLSHMALTPSPK